MRASISVGIFNQTLRRYSPSRVVLISKRLGGLSGGQLSKGTRDMARADNVDLLRDMAGRVGIDISRGRLAVLRN